VAAKSWIKTLKQTIQYKNDIKINDMDESKAQSIWGKINNSLSSRSEFLNVFTLKF